MVIWCVSFGAKNVSSLSMQVYPLLDSVKDTMVASTIRKGDTLRIQAGSLILFFNVLLIFVIITMGQ